MAEDILAGAIDFDLHASPDMVPRKVDVAELARLCDNAGMRGFMIRSHAIPTVGLARLVSESYPHMLIAGNVVLNESVGGLNPEAARIAIEMGARAVWMPTFDSANHIAKLGATAAQGRGAGITILDEHGELVPPVIEIMEIVADSGVVLGTGELSSPEIVRLVRAGKRLGLKKMVVNHPEYWIIDLSDKEQEEMVACGAYIEHSYVFTSVAAPKRISPSKIARMIRKHGHERCIMATDSGNPAISASPEAMLSFVDQMKKEGISQRQIDVMIKENPTKLLGD